MSEVGKYRQGQTEVVVRRRSCGTPEAAMYVVNPNATRQATATYHNLKTARGLTVQQHLDQTVTALQAAINEAQLKAAFTNNFNVAYRSRCGG